jgi:glycosyltransferase involved in cell wall biosynthesis
VAACTALGGLVSNTSVLFVYHDLSSGGLAVDIRNAANGLAGRGRHVGVATMAGVHDLRAKAGLRADVRLFEFPPRPQSGFSRSFGLTSGLRTFLSLPDWGIVHVVSCLPVYLHFAFLRVSSETGRTVVWTPMVHPPRSDYWASRIRTTPMTVFDTVAHFATKYADAIIAATEEEANRFSGKGCDVVRVIPPGVDNAERVSRDRVADFRYRMGLADDPVVLMVAARDEWRKGFDFGMGAFRRLRKLVPTARLLVVGVEGLDEEGIVSAGHLPDDEVPVAFASADAVFVPSRYEAFSRVVIEAWQQARPVVVTDRVGLSSMARSLDNKVVPFGDEGAAAAGVAELLLDTELATKLGRRGLEQVDRCFRLPMILDETEHLYMEATRSSPRW